MRTFHGRQKIVWDLSLKTVQNNTIYKNHAVFPRRASLQGFGWRGSVS